MKVFIVGTDHRFQTADGGAAGAEIEAFRRFLRDVCSTRSIAAIAEEMCLETVHQFGLQKSVCHEEAICLRLKHRYCDPDTEARKPLGIRKEIEVRLQAPGKLSDRQLAAAMRHEDAKREAIWVQELRCLNTWPVLFVCGAWHAEPFRDLLERENIRAEVLASDWSPNPRRCSGPAPLAAEPTRVGLGVLR